MCYYPFSSCLILQIRLLGEKQQTRFSQLRVKICALVTYTTKSNWQQLWIKLNFEWELQLVNGAVLKSSQPTYATYVSCMLCMFFHGKKSSNTHKLSITKISLKILLGHTNGYFLQIAKLFWKITSLSHWLKNRDVQGGHRLHIGIHIPHLL